MYEFRYIDTGRGELLRCAGKKTETVEYLDVGKRGIHIAEYLTELPPREVLRERFHMALVAARARLERREIS